MVVEPGRSDLRQGQVGVEVGTKSYCKSVKSQDFLAVAWPGILVLFLFINDLYAMLILVLGLSALADSREMAVHGHDG